METEHAIYFRDSRDMDAVDDGSVDLTVTSPPYPMIEMWDDLFAGFDDRVADALAAGDGQDAFDRMHAALEDVWAEVARVTAEDGIVCINIGDATRSLDGGAFRLYPNHSRVIRFFRDHGFTPLPPIIWRKPTNSAAKFMGSGMLPPNAYTTLEHEYILVFRNGDGTRQFPAHDDARYESAYFWEERNRWFSDVWTDLNGVGQTLQDDDVRDRAAAYPFMLPYRLIAMYSVYGDTVLDPFLGTGTTTLAAMALARHSIGYERDDGFADTITDRIEQVSDVTRQVNADRLATHRAFLDEQDDAPAYTAAHYDFDVTTKQERQILLRDVDTITATDTGYRVRHVPHIP